MARPIRWLHLSDLHFGCKGEGLWESMEEQFFHDVQAHLDRTGASPDLLLFTGDLVNRGTASEFDGVQKMLGRLSELFEQRGAQPPILLPVPGNHEVVRPQGRDALIYRVLRCFDGYVDVDKDPDVASLHHEMWGEKQDPSFIEPLFSGYRIWFEQRVRPQLKARATRTHFSPFPCDFRAEIHPDGAFPLAVVGLNSTWIQYTGGDFDGELLIPAQQYRAAIAGDDEKPSEIYDRNPQSLLLMHQPPSWLCERGLEIFNQDIYPPGRFALCLHGHMHKPMNTYTRGFGGSPRTFLQAPSLFGLHKYGSKDEDRILGYSWGQISKLGEIRIWPRSLEVAGDGSSHFGFDRRFVPDAQDPLCSMIRPADIAPAGLPAGGSKTQPQPASSPPNADHVFSVYLQDLRNRVSFLELQGLASEDQTESLNPALDRLYTPLYGRDPGSLDVLAGGIGGHLGRGDGRQRLEDLLPAHPKTLIEGPPGCGKSTFLRWVVSWLVRSALGESFPTGGSQDLQALGKLDASIPVLLPLEGLARKDSDRKGSDKPWNRERLLDHLEMDCSRKGLPFDRQIWKKALADGRVCLFLDGLDEVADPLNRERVLAILEDAGEHWRSRMVVASRPFLTEGLCAAGFVKLDVESLETEDIRCFLAKWVAMLHEERSKLAQTGAQKEYRAKLEGAILRADLRRLASNPMMLTCLCVVHWGRGELPKGRARIYEAVLRWLLEARKTRRLKRFGLRELEAQEALSRLASAAMGLGMNTGEQDAKRVTLDLDEAASTVAVVFERANPALDAEARSIQAREWLIFEAGESGILEELPGDRLRFWHLTFQEYLAAVRLAKPQVGDDWWPHLKPRLDDAQWRETVELFASCLQLFNDVSHVDRLLQLVLDLRSDGTDLAQDARVAAILGRLFPALEVYDYRPEPGTSRLYEELMERVKRIFTKEGAGKVPVKQRIAAAEAVGQGGDWRLRPEDLEDRLLEVPGTKIRLGKYPVTVEEYQHFVDAQGYDDPDWWSSEGWQRRQKHGWSEPGVWAEQLATPNRPVVTVSWFEAEAYCNWLSSHYPKGEIRLPTNDEWEKAATHPRGEFPWGEPEPTPELANFADSKIRSASPVGVYPLGIGPYGHLDLAGNVWEWCLDRLDDGARRPVRGGCWILPASFLRSALRGRLVPVNRVGHLGFRVSCALSTS